MKDRLNQDIKVGDIVSLSTKRYGDASLSIGVVLNEDEIIINNSRYSYTKYRFRIKRFSLATKYNLDTRTFEYTNEVYTSITNTTKPHNILVLNEHYVIMSDMCTDLKQQILEERTRVLSGK